MHKKTRSSRVFLLREGFKFNDAALIQNYDNHHDPSLDATYRLTLIQQL